MRIINHFISSAIISSIALVLLTLAGLECLMEFLGQLPTIGTAHYSFGIAMLYISLQLPVDVYQLSPIAGFIGCIVGLGRLSNNSELLVIRAAGVSVLQITLAVLKTAFIIMLLMGLLGEVIAPPLQNYGYHIRTQALGKSIGLHAINDIWLRNKNEFVHFNGVSNIKRINDVDAYLFKGNQLEKIAHADLTEFIDGKWRMIHPTVFRFTSNAIQSKQEKKLNLSVIFNPIEQQNPDWTPDMLSIISLAKTIHYRKEAELATNQYEFTLWQRLIQPISTIVMICLGIPFIFGSLRQSSIGKKILTGMLVGFIFYISNQFFGPIAMLDQISPALAASIPTLFFGLLCVILLHRIN